MKFLFIMLAGCFFIGCKSPAQDDKLPASRPIDFSLTYHVDAGMVDLSENLFLSKDSCIYIKSDTGKEVKNKFILSDMEMDALYGILKQNKYSRIESRTEGEVYDRGGISIHSSWNKDKNELNVSDAGNSFVKDKWRKDWGTICDYLATLLEKKISNK